MAEESATAEAADAPSAVADEATGEKHGGDQPELVAFEMPPFADGAQTFDEFDQWEGSVETQAAVDEQMIVFDRLAGNIRGDEDISVQEKVRRLQKLTLELEERVGEAGEGERTADEKQGETKRVDGQDLKRGDFADRGEAGKPGTWKLPLTRTPGGVNAGRIRDAITALQPGGFRGEPVDLTESRSTVIGHIRTAIGKLDDKAAKERLSARLNNLRGARSKDPGAVAVLKTEDGVWRWLAIHTNKFEDSEGEIFSEASHRKYVEWADKTHTYPPLRLWHVPADIGIGQMVDYTDEGFMISAGVFRDGMEDVAERLAGEKELRCSHGYAYDYHDLRDGVYHAYRTFEVSVIPAGPESNSLTAFFADEEVPMLSDDKREWLTKILGEARVVMVEGTLAELKAHADEENISYKALIEMLMPSEAIKADADDVAPAADADADADADASAEDTDAAATESGATAETDAVADAAADAAADSDGAEEGNEEGEEGDAEKTEADLSDPVKLLQAIEQVVEKQVTPLAERLDAMDADVKTLKEGTDAAVAGLIRPKVGPVATTPASQSDDNVVPDSLDTQLRKTIEAAGGLSGGDGSEPEDRAGDYAGDALALVGMGPATTRQE